jgi:hypothetical protein
MGGQNLWQLFDCRPLRSDIFISPKWKITGNRLQYSARSNGFVEHGAKAVCGPSMCPEGVSDAYKVPLLHTQPMRIVHTEAGVVESSIFCLSSGRLQDGRVRKVQFEVVDSAAY